MSLGSRIFKREKLDRYLETDKKNLLKRCQLLI